MMNWWAGSQPEPPDMLHCLIIVAHVCVMRKRVQSQTYGF